jgi:hypothetical protein
MITRVIVVEFYPEVTSEEVAAFRGWLQELASRSVGLVRMTCGEHRPTPSEASHSANAPSATIGHFASIWEFTDEEALDTFLLQPFHRALAATKFRQVVKQRYLTNIH